MNIQVKHLRPITDHDEVPKTALLLYKFHHVWA